MELKTKLGRKLWREGDRGTVTAGRCGETGKAEPLLYDKSQHFPKEGSSRRQKEHGMHEEEDIKAGMNWETVCALSHWSPVLG